MIYFRHMKSWSRLIPPVQLKPKRNHTIKENCKQRKNIHAGKALKSNEAKALNKAIKISRYS